MCCQTKRRRCFAGVRGRDTDDDGGRAARPQTYGLMSSQNSRNLKICSSGWQKPPHRRE